MRESIKITLIIIISGIILILPNTIRALNNNQYMINSDSYYTLRTYNQQFDGLQQRPLPFSIFHYIPLFENIVIARVLPLLLGIMTALLSYFILRKHNMPEKNINAIIILLIVSPIFIYTFSELKLYAVALALTLLCILLLSYKKIALASILFIIIPLIDIYASILSLVFVFIYIALSNKSLKNNLIFILIALISVAAAIGINYFFNYPIFKYIPIESPNLLSDTGIKNGFSFSSLILSLIGLILLWEKGLKNIIIYVSFILILVLSMFSTSLKAYINMILIIFAGFAFIYLNRRKWSIQLIKRVTILLIICSILFTTILFITKTSNLAPDADYVDAMLFIKKQSNPEEKILSSPDNGFMLQYYTDRATYLDDKSSMFDKELLIELSNLTSSRNLERTENILSKNNLRYVFIDKDFKQFLEQEEGLLYIIETSNKFTNIYKSNKAEVWLYTE